MRVGGSGAAWANQSNAVGNWQQRQQNMKALGTALQGGDLAAAQQAFATISASNPAAAANSNSPLAKIGQALQAGDLATAQQAAQAWRGARDGKQTQALSGSSLAANTATNTFLQTLTPISTATSGTSAATSSAAVPSAATSDQITQALAAFEKNLFDSLHAQDAAISSAGASGSSTAATTAPTAAAITDPTQAPSTATPAATSSASASAAPVPGHHHHHGGGGGVQLQAELSSLIDQTSTTASGTSPASTAATGTASLDQSFQNLLGSLGVTGNNASLNTFLQAMSANMQSEGVTSGAAMA